MGKQSGTCEALERLESLRGLAINALMNIQIRVMSAQAMAEFAKLNAAQKAFIAQGAVANTAAAMGGAATGMMALEKWGNKAQWAGRQLSYNFTMPLALAAAAGTKFALDNEAAMVRMQKVYGTGARDAKFYEKEIVSLGKAFEMLSNQYGVARADVINIAADWAAAGSSGVALAKATKLTMDAMILGEMDAKAATEALIAIQAQYSLSTEDLSKTIDVLNMVENQTGITMEGLITGMARAAGTARDAGIDVRHLSAMLAAMVPAAGTASQAGNAIKTMISRLLSPTKEAAEVMGMFGVNTAEMGWNSMNAVQRMDAMSKSFAKLTGPQKAIASATIASRFQINKFSTLMRDMIDPLGYYQRSLRATANETANFDQKTKELAAVLESNPRKLKIIWTNLQNMMADVVAPMLPYIVALAAGFVSLMKQFQNLDPAVQKLILAFLLFVALLGPVLKYLGSLVTMIGYLGNGLKATGALLGWFVKALIGLAFAPFKLIAVGLWSIGSMAISMSMAILNAFGLQAAVVVFKNMMKVLVVTAASGFYSMVAYAANAMLLIAARFLASGPVIAAVSLLMNVLGAVWAAGLAAMVALQKAFIPVMLVLWSWMQAGMLALQKVFTIASIALWGFMQNAIMNLVKAFSFAIGVVWGLMFVTLRTLTFLGLNLIGIVWGVGQSAILALIKVFSFTVSVVWNFMHAALATGTKLWSTVMHGLWAGMLAALMLLVRVFSFTVGVAWGLMFVTLRTLTFLGLNAIGVAWVVSTKLLMGVVIVLSRSLAAIWFFMHEAMLFTTAVFMPKVRALWMLLMASLGAIVSGGFKMIIMGVVKMAAVLFAAITSPWGLAIAAVLLLVSIFRKQIAVAWNGVVAWFQTAIPRIGLAFQPLTDYFGNAVDFIKRAFWSLPAGIQGAFLTVVSIVRKAAMAVYDLFSYFNPFAKHSPSLVDNVSKGMKVVGTEHNAIGAVGGTMDKAAGSVQSFKNVTGGVDAVKNNFSAPMVKATGDLRNFQNATSSITPAPFADQRADMAKVLPSALPSMDRLIADLASLNKVLATQKAAVDAQQATVDGWRKRLDAANAAIDVQQKTLDGLQGNLDRLTTSYEAHKTALQEYASAPLVGMKAVDDALFSNSMAQKRLELQIARTAAASADSSAASQAELDILKSRVDSLTQSLDAHKAALQGYVNAPLVGMKAMGDAIFENNMAQKELQLQMLKMGETGGESIDSLRNKYALLQGEIETLNGMSSSLRMDGAGSDILGTYDTRVNDLKNQQAAITIDSSPMSALQKQLEDLQKQAQIMELEKALKFDPLQKQISDMADSTKELTFAEITAGITSENAAIAALTPQLDSATASYDSAKTAMDNMVSATAGLEAQLARLQNQAQIMDLEKSLRFEPLQRQIADLADTSKELTFSEIVNGINREKAAMAALEPQINAATAAVARQQGVVDSMTAARDAIAARYDTENAKLGVLNDSYQKTEGLIRNIESALNDMGSAASGKLAKKKTLTPAGQNFQNAGDADFPDVGGKSGISREGGLGDQSAQIDEWMKQNGGDIAKAFGKIDMFKPLRDMWNKGWKWMEVNVFPKVAPVVTALKQAWNDSVAGIFGLNDQQEYIGNGATAATKTVGDKLKSGFGNIAGMISDWWNKNISPIIKLLAPGFIDTWNAIYAAGEKIWKELLPGITDMFKELWPIVKVVAQIVGGALLLAFKVITAVLGKVLGPALNMIIDVVKGVVRVIKGVAEVIVALFTWDKDKLTAGIRDIVSGLFVAIGSIIKNSWNIIWGLVEGLIGGIIGFFQYLWDVIIGHSIIPDLINGIVDWFKSLGPWVINHVKTFITNTVDWFGKLPGKVWDAIITLKDKLGTAASDAFNKFKSVASALWSGSKGILTWLGGLAANVWDKVKTIPGKLITAASDAFNGFKKSASDKWSGAKGILVWLGGLATNVWDKVKTIPGKLINAASDAFNGFKKSASDKWTGAKGILVWLGGLATNVWDKVKTIPGKLINAASDAFNGFKKNASDKWSGAKGILVWLGGLAASVWEKVKSIPGQLITAAYNAFSGFLSKAKSMWDGKNGIMTWIGGLSAKVAAKFAGIGTAVAGAVRGAWNAAAKWINTNGIANVNKALKLFSVEIPPLKTFAKGGVIPGGQSKTDNMLIRARSGEGVILPETVGAIGGAGGLNMLNRIAANGGSLMDFVKRAGVPGFASGGLIGFGNYLRNAGFQVGEHPMFGGVAPVHTTNSQHYNKRGPGGGGAIDVNHDGAGQARETAAINSIVGMARGYGLRTLWQIKDHFNHAHFDIGAGASSSSVPDVAKGWWDNIKTNASSAWNATTGKVGDITGAIGSWMQKGAGYGLNKIMGPLGGLLRKSIPGDSFTEKYMAGMFDHIATKAKAWGDKQDSAVPAGGDGSAHTGNAGANQRAAAVMIGRFGWGPGQMSSLIPLWNAESGWNQFASNGGGGPDSGRAYGIPQSLPGSKMAASGSDWRTNPITQMDWGMHYIKSRPDYGTPAAAYRKFLSRSPHWYDDGGYLKPGMTNVANMSRKPEPVFSASQWSTVRALVAASTNVLKSSGVAGVGSATGLRGTSLVNAQGRLTRFGATQTSQSRSSSKTELHFHGDLTFPSVKTGDDAKSFIRNLESLAG